MANSVIYEHRMGEGTRLKAVDEARHVLGRHFVIAGGVTASNQTSFGGRYWTWCVHSFNGMGAEANDWERWPCEKSKSITEGGY